jgi:2-polyprenyl-3-methyl-5-hydroxy-6-metoxy-1,4-benzoquinol methylase
MKQWYEELFENYGLKYDQEVFTQGTLGECDFIEKESGYNIGIKILDIGCGTGRHSIELTKRGYNVTGVDLSESQLVRARQKAREQNLDIKFLMYDARLLPFNKEFDLAIMLCEGGFPLMETDEMNFQILESAARALKAEGKLIFTTLNGLFPLFHSVKEFIEQSQEMENTKPKGLPVGATNSQPTGLPVGATNSQPADLSFDLMTFRDHNITTFTDDDGNEKELDCNERYYVPSEITWLLKSLGFKKINIYGAKLGAFSRNDKLTTEDFEMLVISEK